MGKTIRKTRFWDEYGHEFVETIEDRREKSYRRQQQRERLHHKELELA